MAGRGGYRAGAGRPIAAHTLQAETAKAALIALYIKNAKPINLALIKKAKAGDIQAIRELHERVFRKVTQPLGGDKDNPLIIAMNRIAFHQYGIKAGPERK